MEYDVYYATGGSTFVGGGADIWVNYWLDEIYPKLNFKSKLCIHRSRPGVQAERDEYKTYDDRFENCEIVWAGDNIGKFNDTIREARRVHILHGFYTPHKIIDEVKDKIYSNIVHVSTELSLNSGKILNLNPMRHFAAYVDWEYQVNSWAKTPVWVGIDKTPMHNKFKFKNIPNFYEFEHNKELSDSDVIGFASRVESRKAMHFMDGLESLAFTNPYDFYWWKNNLPHQFKKTKLVAFRPDKIHDFYNRENWGISHSCFVDEPFGYSIFQSVDYGKIPILYPDWCKNYDYPYRAATKEEFNKVVDIIKRTSYEIKNNILKELREYLKERFENKEKWVNEYLSIYNT